MTFEQRSRALTLYAAETQVPAPARGMVLDGRYELRRVLGEGGMGQVWEAEHLGLGRMVAVKLVDARYESLHPRLLREARVLASLRHPAIVEVFDVGTSSVGPFIAMERLVATPLDELIARGPLGVQRTVELFLPILDGLQLAHDRGIVHRDIKPSNVLVCGALAGHGDDLAPSARPTAKLLDFGIAVTATDARLTQSGAILGTPAYMAPEQVRSARVDPRTDVWGIAVTMLEAMSGRLVFDGEDPASIMAKVLSEEVEQPQHVAAMDDELWRIFQHALCKDPDARLGSARLLHDALRAWTDGASMGSAPWTGEPSPRSPRAAEPDLGTLDALIRARLGDA